jgi:ferric-dicitrate binding protein FerR (iron transport regulator)
MGTRDTPARRGARWARGLLLALLCGCAGLHEGPVHPGMDSRATLPRLYADPGVRIERPAQGLIAYTKGMALQTGDVIQTADGYAVIDFDRGNVVDLRPNTRIQLGSITLFFGELFARIVDIAAHGGGQVVTDELAASVEGTEYAVRRTVAPGHGNGSAGSTAVIVRAGHVRCGPRASGAWPEVVVGANLVFRVETTRAPDPPSPIDAVAETRWAEEVERRLLKPRAPVPGSPIRRPRGPRQRRPSEPG